MFYGPEMDPIIGNWVESFIKGLHQRGFPAGDKDTLRERTWPCIAVCGS